MQTPALHCLRGRVRFIEFVAADDLSRKFFVRGTIFVQSIIYLLLFYKIEI